MGVRGWVVVRARLDILVIRFDFVGSSGEYGCLVGWV